MLEYMITEHAVDSKCIIHDADLPFPDYLRDVEYHLIVLGPTFLCNRHTKSIFEKALNDYSFIKSSRACKIALPQDDYDTSGVLDRWMVDWNIDRVYSVIPHHLNLLYPNYSQCGDIKLGFTGYISDDWIKVWANPKPHKIRTIDISYRTHNNSVNRCSLRNLKYAIADRFSQQIRAIAPHIRLDISANTKDLIPGTRWHEFVENSKFCLTTPSGSSLLDPEGIFRRRVIQYCIRNPNANFQDVAKACFQGKDNQYIFSAISPRNIEAALAETIQIATPGSYSELMMPLEHLIPLKEDCSNVAEIIEMMQDYSFLQYIQRNCKASILDEPRLRVKTIVDEIITFAEHIVTQRRISGTTQERVNQLFSRYEQDIESCAKLYWRKQQIIRDIKSLATKFGARRIKNFFVHQY